jgi:hypothetical protein
LVLFVVVYVGVLGQWICGTWCWCFGRTFFNSWWKWVQCKLVLEAHYEDFLQDMNQLLMVCGVELTTMFSFQAKKDAYACVKFLSCMFWCGGRMPHPLSL